MLKISYAGYIGISPVISVQFTLEMCATTKNREKLTNPYFKSSRSFKVIGVGAPESSSAVHVCVYLYYLNSADASLCLSAAVLMPDELIAVI